MANDEPAPEGPSIARPYSSGAGAQAEPAESPPEESYGSTDASAVSHQSRTEPDGPDRWPTTPRPEHDRPTHEEVLKLIRFAVLQGHRYVNLERGAFPYSRLAYSDGGVAQAKALGRLVRALGPAKEQVLARNARIPVNETAVRAFVIRSRMARVLKAEGREAPRTAARDASRLAALTNAALVLDKDEEQRSRTTPSVGVERTVPTRRRTTRPSGWWSVCIRSGNDRKTRTVQRSADR